MSKRKAIKYSNENYPESSDDEESDEGEENLFIPNGNYSGSDRDSSSDDENNDPEIPVQNVSYRSVCNNYTEKQKKLEPDHIFSWSDGEQIYSADLEDQLFLSAAKRREIARMSDVELFELFFSSEIKNYIIEASQVNGLQISVGELNTFVGIILLSSINIRHNQYEYWETDSLVNCPDISSAMSRNRFKEIKSKLKYSKPTDQNNIDKAWKVREILQLFRKNIQQFGFFSTALSVDEMMVRFFGRTCLRQYLPSKPDRYGMKLWALCGANGFIFNVDIYCGKNDSSIGINLSSCPLGSRVVLQMVNPLLCSLPKRKLSEYHLYFDNYFTSPDLVIHLNKFGLKSTGTVRRDRVKEKHVFQKKAPRGTYKVSHERNSGMNFVSVIDSKEVSILSTAAGASPITSVKRYSKTDHERKEIGFPFAFSLYNKYMGGVDVHDFRSKKVSPSIRSKKWTYAIFVRIIQMSIANAVILKNLCKKDDEREMKTRQLCKEVSREYLLKSRLGDLKSHRHESKMRRRCNNQGCSQRTTRFCIDCKKYYCIQCYSQLHAG